MADSSGIYSDKSYKLSKLMIYPASGQSIDISYILGELSIFEDIYNDSLSGSVIVSESLDLVSLLPLSGFDYLLVVFSKPGDDTDTFTKTFRIYSIDKVMINFGNMSNQAYQLNFCSEENIISVSNRIFKSYKGKTTSDIARDILNNIVKAKGLTFVDDSKGQYDIIVPGWSPFYTLNWLANRSDDGAFMFYENTDGLNFRSLEKLLAQDTSLKYKYEPKNVTSDTENMDDQVRTVIKYEYMDEFDTLRAIKEGMFGSDLLTLDLVRLKADEVKLRYDTYFNKIKHTESSPNSFDVGLKNRLSKTPSDNNFSLRRYFPTTKDHDKDGVITARQPGIKQNLVEQWMLQRISRLEQLNYLKIKFVAPGNIVTNVGDMIEFTVPAIKQKDPNGTNLQEFQSGRFLITAIRHKINFDHWEMIVEATKDCLAKALTPAVSDMSKVV